MRRILSMIWAFVTGAIILAVANNTAITNMTTQAAGNIAGHGSN
jgi:hypothetical protein